jgi:hypothetical protein
VNLTNTPLTDHAGAEIMGLDLARLADAEHRAAPSRAFARHNDNDPEGATPPLLAHADGRGAGMSAASGLPFGCFGAARSTSGPPQTYLALPASSYDHPARNGGRKGRMPWETTGGGRPTRLR